jgi:hypothetical protein
MKRRLIYEAEGRGGMSLMQLREILDDARKLDISAWRTEPKITLNRPTAAQRSSRAGVIRKVEIEG